MRTENDAAMVRHNGEQKPKGLMARFAEEHGLSVEAMYQTLAKTIFPTPKDATNEQIHALLIVADQYKLNPWTKEIFAFPAKGGGIVPIVGVDGWYRMVNSHPDCDGIQVTVEMQDGKPFSATCRIHRKSWSHPVELTEYLSECKRNTDPWRNQPTRMLRHRAVVQAARVAFGFSGIYEPDEGARFAEDVPRGVREVDLEPDPLDAALAPVDLEPEPYHKTAASSPQTSPQNLRGLTETAPVEVDRGQVGREVAANGREDGREVAANVEFVPDTQVAKLVKGFERLGLSEEYVDDKYGPLDQMTREAYDEAVREGVERKREWEAKARERDEKPMTPANLYGDDPQDEEVAYD